MLKSLTSWLAKSGILPHRTGAPSFGNPELEELLHALPSIVSIIDADWRFEMLNQTFEAWYGIPVTQATGKKVSDLLGPIFETIRPRLERAMAGERVQFEVFQAYPKAGPKYVNILYIPRRDRSGRVTGIFANISDITLHKLAESKIQSSERVLDQVFVDSPAFMCVLTGPDFIFERANREYLRLFGIDASKIGQPIAKVLPSAEKQGFIDLLRDVVATQKSFSATEALFSFQLPSGENRSVYVDFVYQPLRDHEGNVTGVIAHGYDVTAKVLSRTGIENERSNFRNLFRQTPEMVCILSGPEHVFEFVNDAHVKALGFDATGMKVRQAQPESVEVHGILDEVYRTGKTAELREIPVTVTDRLRYFNLTYAARRDERGQVNGIMILGVEITDQIQNRQKLLEAVRSRDEFLSIASHELRTPLTSMQLQAQLRLKMIKSENPEILKPEKLQKLFETDFNQVRRLSRLIDDMLDISRIEAGKFVLSPESVDLSQLVRDVVAQYEPQLKEAGSDVILDQVEPVVGSWDRFRLEQVLANLLTNAMKYGSGKTIHLSLQRRPEGLARITVRDQGIGIAKENLERIFDRFERAISATEVSGLGLGLYIARQIVELHQGQIHVQSTVGKGSVFTVDLPLGHA